LLRNTSDLAQRSRQGQALDALFADNTRGAIEQGTMHALAALAVRATEAMARTTGSSPALLLTGGGSERLAAVLGISCLEVPDLVLRGLAVLATEAPP
jgi:type III pantothenate kinase